METNVQLILLGSAPYAITDRGGGKKGKDGNFRGGTGKGVKRGPCENLFKKRKTLAGSQVESLGRISNEIEPR